MTRPHPLVLIALAALVVLLWAAFLRPSADDRYTSAVRDLCTTTDQSIEPFSRSGNHSYYEIVVMISNRKASGLARIDPPADRRALHVKLLASERRLTKDAQQWVGSDDQTFLAHFHPMRAEQARLEARYRTLGIVGCSN